MCIYCTINSKEQVKDQLLKDLQQLRGLMVKADKPIKIMRLKKLVNRGSVSFQYWCRKYKEQINAND